MPTTQFSDPFLRNIRATGTQSEWSDTLARGLRIRVTQKGTKTFSLVYRNAAGKQRRYTLGTYPAMTLAEARARARSTQIDVQAGADPAQRDSGDERAPELISALLEQHLSEWARRVRKGTLDDLRSCWNRVLLTELGTLQPKQVARRDVRRIVEHLANTGHPHASNFALGALRTFFGWCVERDIIDASPVAGIRPLVPNGERDRVLSDSELVRIWHAAGDVGYPFGPIVRLLILTGQRRDEIACLRRSELVGDRIELPAERTKSGRRHDVPLTRLALAILEGLPRFGDGDFLFSTTYGRTPVSGWTRAKERLDKASGVTDWRIHDLRRTVASGLARDGVPPQVISAVLNHSPKSIMGVTAIYNRHRYDAEKRAALDAWASRVGAVVTRKAA